MSQATPTIDEDNTLIALLAGSAVFFLLCWRIDVLINDSYVFGNTLVALRNGQLRITKLVYVGLIPAQPGLYVSDGAIYGRNYGQVFFALPVLLALQGVAQFIDPMIVISGTWSLLIILFVNKVQKIRGFSQTVTYTGAVVALLLFGVNLWLLQPISRNWYPHMALQLTSVATATATVGIVYKLGTVVASKRIGVFAGGLAALASPVGFWATLSKRHTLTGFLALLCLYGLFQSRAAVSQQTAFRYRILTYGSVGITAWISSIEGLLLALAVVPIDLLTARTSFVRSIGIASIVLTIAFIPFFVTNFLISGNPLLPPRALPGATVSDVSAAIGPGTGSIETINQPTQAGEDGTEGLINVITTSAAGRVLTFVSYIQRSALLMLVADRWYTVFIRSSYGVLSSSQFSVPARDLSMLESMPTLGTVGGVVVLAVQRARQTDWGLREITWTDPHRTADAFAILYAAWLLVIYLPQLPLRVTYTVRYLYPVYLLGFYAIARLDIVQQTVEAEWRRLLRTYMITTMLGGVGLLLTLGFLIPNPSGFARNMSTYTAAFHIHAVAGAVSGVFVVGWSIYAATNSNSQRLGAVVLGNAAGIASLYLFFSALRYFAVTSQYALPISRIISLLLGAV